MFNPTQIVITAFVRELREMYSRSYGTLEPGFPGIISFVAQLALENIATSDAPYHVVNHTIMVTLVGQEILRGRHLSVGGVTPRGSRPNWWCSSAEQAASERALDSAVASERLAVVIANHR